MPQILTSRRVRCRVPVGAPFTTTPLQDAFTSQTLESVRGNATRFEFGFFDVIGTPLDLSEVESLNLKLQPSQTVDSPLADKTITTLDLSLDAATWDDGSKQHAVFQFSNAEMNINPQGERRTLWLVITAITTGGDEITLTAGSFFLHEDNNGSLATPPENPGAYLTLEQGDARYPKAITSVGAPVNGSAGTAQVETLTVVAAAGATSTGTIAGNIFFCPSLSINSMVTYSVDMTTDTTAALIAEKLRAAYDAVTAINAAFILTRSGANIIATRRTPAANDASFVFSAGVGRGVTAGSSANTTAGVAPVAGTAGMLGQPCITATEDVYMCVQSTPVPRWKLIG